MCFFSVKEYNIETECTIRAIMYSSHVANILYVSDKGILLDPHSEEIKTLGLQRYLYRFDHDI